MDMQIMDLMSIGILGSLVSIFIQFIKGKFSNNSNSVKLLTIGLSVCIGGVYYLFRDTAWYLSMIGILTVSSTVYAFILKK